MQYPNTTRYFSINNVLINCYCCNKFKMEDGNYFYPPKSIRELLKKKYEIQYLLCPQCTSNTKSALGAILIEGELEQIIEDIL